MQVQSKRESNPGHLQRKGVGRERIMCCGTTHEAECLGDSLSLPDSICQVTPVYQVMTRD